jgi:hypothetical protein
MGRSFNERFKENFSNFKHMHRKSKYATRLLDNRHLIGQINEITDIVYIGNKESHLNTLEKFCVYKETTNGNQINNKNTIRINKLFEVVIQGENSPSPHPRK